MIKLMMTLMAVFIAIAANTQYTTNYYNHYGCSIGSSTTQSNNGGGTTTTYYDSYGNCLASSYSTDYDWQ